MHVQKPPPWLETTLNYWMIMERYPNPKEEVGNSIPDHEIPSLLDKTLARWRVPLVLWRWHVGFYLKQKASTQKNLPFPPVSGNLLTPLPTQHAHVFAINKRNNKLKTTIKQHSKLSALNQRVIKYARALPRGSSGLVKTRSHPMWKV